MRLDALDPYMTLKEVVIVFYNRGFDIRLVMTKQDYGAAVRLLELLHAAARWHEESKGGVEP